MEGRDNIGVPENCLDLCTYPRIVTTSELKGVLFWPPRLI